MVDTGVETGIETGVGYIRLTGRRLSTEKSGAVTTVERNGAVTLADVAEQAGVSKATASKALLDRYGVSPATRQRVRQVAEELSFRPNLLARGLGGGRTHTVGMITTDLEGRFAPQIMAGLEDALGAERSSVIMCNTRGRADLETHHLEDLLQRSVDGLVVVGNFPEPRPPVAIESPVPVIYAFASSTDPTDTSIVCDNVEAGRLATEHLISTGKRRLVYLGGEEQDLAARERGAGFTEAMRQNVLQPAAEEVYGAWSEQFGWDATSDLLRRGVSPDGLVCGDDQIARGALDRLHAAGLELPLDAAVIGFDNWAVVSQYSRHPFSSVDLNLWEIGRAAARALAGPDGPQPGVQKICGRVEARGSTVRT